MSRGELIRQRRLAHPLELNALVAEADITRQCWWKVETGKTPDPKIKTLQGIARALGCQVSDIWRDDDGTRPTGS